MKYPFITVNAEVDPVEVIENMTEKDIAEIGLIRLSDPSVAQGLYEKIYRAAEIGDIIRTPPATKPSAPNDNDSDYVGIEPADIPVLGSTKPEKPAMYIVVQASAFNRFESEQAAREHALSNMDNGESVLIACIVAAGKKTIVWEEA